MLHLADPDRELLTSFMLILLGLSQRNCRQLHQHSIAPIWSARRRRRRSFSHSFFSCSALLGHGDAIRAVKTTTIRPEPVISDKRAMREVIYSAVCCVLDNNRRSLLVRKLLFLAPRKDRKSIPF